MQKAKDDQAKLVYTQSHYIRKVLDNNNFTYRSIEDSYSDVEIIINNSNIQKVELYSFDRYGFYRVLILSDDCMTCDQYITNKYKYMFDPFGNKIQEGLLYKCFDNMDDVLNELYHVTSGINIKG